MIIILVSVLFILVIFDYWHRKRVYKSALSFPNLHFYNFPFIGQALALFGNSQERMTTFQNIARETSKMGGVSRLWFGTRLFVVVTEPDVAELVLKTFLEKDQLMDICRDVTGSGSIFAPVSVWRPRRKLLIQSFSPRILKNFVEVFDKAGQEMVKHLEKVPSGELFSIFPFIGSCTMRSVCESNLGVKMTLENKELKQFLENFERVCQVVSVRLTQPVLNAVFKILPQYKTFCNQREFLHNFIDKVIQSRREVKKREQEIINETDRGSKSAQNSRRSFLEMLMEHSSPVNLTDSELRDECIVINFAGTDTSAVAASFFLCMMARHPHKQDRVHGEITKLFGTTERAVNHEDLQKLPYLEAVLKETLRLYPPVPVIVRSVDKFISLNPGETLVPGMGILINIWGIHRNPKYWGPDADLFRPERFMNRPLPHPVAFLPFSQGPRNCIGHQYAMMSIKTILVTFLRRFHILPTFNSDASEPGLTNCHDEKPMQVQFNVMMKDVDQFTIRMEKRKFE